MIKALSTKVTQVYACKQSSGSINLLLVVALATDLLTPFLIWKGILPAYTRWISHAALATIMVGTYTRMMALNRVPGVVWVIAVISATSVSVALFGGQGVVATAWGWWVMFQYPLVGLYAYLQPHWPERFPQRLRISCAAILSIEVLVQIGQYLTGRSPGDQLAGTFGRQGTANLVIFILLVLCLALGRWLAHGQWKMLLLVLAMGSVSSTLGETKLFPFAALALGMLTIVVLTLRGGQLWKLASCAVLMGLVVWGYIGLYDVVVPAARMKPFERYFELQSLARYLGHANRYLADGRYRYDIGRNYAVAYGWNAICSDTTTLLFGLGLGARGESRTLGTAGVGLLRGHLGLTTGTSLLVIMQETGIVGMVTLGGFILWIVITLFKDIRRHPRSEVVELRYALFLFSLLWPLWLWYHTVWTMRVPMLLYWAALGYVLSEPQGHKVDAQQSRIRSLSREYRENTE